MAKNPTCAVIGCHNVGNDKHHIGGSGSPMIWLCNRCHGLIHGTVWDAEHTALTIAGLARARAQGRIGGNPGLRAKDPEAIRKVREGRDAVERKKLLDGMSRWLPTVERMRPAWPWADVTKTLNLRPGPKWTVERLRRSVRRLVAEGWTDASVLDRAARKDSDERLIRVIAGIRASNQDRTLQEIARQLEVMGQHTPRGGTRWHASSILHLLRKAEKAGIYTPPSAIPLKDPYTELTD
jgi:hypothetical protein